jgi:hypothetical protein
VVYFLSKFQKPLLLIIVNMLYTGSLDLIILLTESSYTLTKNLLLFPSPSSPGSEFCALGFYEFNLLRFGVYGNHAVFVFLCLVYFTSALCLPDSHNVTHILEFSSSVRMDSVPFCMCLTYSSLLTQQQSCRLFPYHGYYE